MRYDPNSKNDPSDIKKGIYRWTVVNATEKTAVASGYDYLNLQMAVNIPGREKPLSVYAKLLTHPDMIWQLEQFCKAVGLDYMDGDIDPIHCIGKQGYAEFDYGKENDKGRKYLEVQRYLHDEELQEFMGNKVLAEAETEDTPKDGIPF